MPASVQLRLAQFVESANAAGRIGHGELAADYHRGRANGRDGIRRVLEVVGPDQIEADGGRGPFEKHAAGAARIVGDVEALRAAGAGRLTYTAPRCAGCGEDDD